MPRSAKQSAQFVALPTGEEIPAFGIGTWKLGNEQHQRENDVTAIRRALELGVRLIDTAEMYGDGGAEECVGEALRQWGGSREQVFVVTKVYPHHASVKGVQAACERSLARLKLKQIDLYLLHWRGSVPLAQTVAGFEALRQQGLIRHWGVSNFDVDDLKELFALPQGTQCAVNQVYYSLSERGIEVALLPWMRRHLLPLMAYCPLGEGHLVHDKNLIELAKQQGISSAQLALAWLLRQGVIAIPKAVQAAHLQDNFAATTVELKPEIVRDLEQLFPAPQKKQPLAVI